MDSKRIETEIKRGLSVVCATCRKYWRGKDLGLKGCGEDCFGPIKGGSFPQYDGALPDLMRWCFVCGQDSFYALQMEHSERRVGVCKTHLPHLHDLVPQDGIVQEGQLFAARNGSMVRVSRIVQRSKTLFETMADQEKTWRAEDEKVAEELGIDPDHPLSS